LLASGSVDWLVCLWDLAIGALQQTIDGHQSLDYDESPAHESVAFSPDGRLIASCSANGIVRLWDPKTGAITQIFDDDDYESPVQIMTFSPDGLFLVSGSYESPIVRLWNTTTGAITQTLDGHSYAINSVTFSPDSRLLVSCSADHTVCLWDLEIGVV
jgi:WD40 repeat protein